MDVAGVAALTTLPSEKAQGEPLDASAHVATHSWGVMGSAEGNRMLG